MESVDFLTRLSILQAEQEKNFSSLAQILGPALAGERSADAPTIHLTNRRTFTLFTRTLSLFTI